MSETFKVSGKKLTLAKKSKEDFKFTVRPGGWVLAVTPDGTRRRFALHEDRGHVSVSLRGYLWSGECVKEGRQVEKFASKDDLSAKFPGKVRKILVQEGVGVLEG